MSESKYLTSPAFSVKASATAVVATFLLLGGTVMGCTTKNYVRSQTAPIVSNINDLDTKTAADHRAIVDTDERAQAGVHGAMTAADAANQHALAGNLAHWPVTVVANAAAQTAANRVDSLSGVIAELDKYKPLADVSVTFAFDKAALTPADKKQLDGLAVSLGTTRGYILQVTGGTDSVGDAQYNYQLSQRRADAVVSYLAVKYNVPPHKFYLVGIGKDEQVASDKTSAGRAKNRRVDVQLLSNMSQVADGAAASGAMR